MAYVSRTSRPAEYANKSNHSSIINDEDVKKFLEDCELPKEASEIDFEKDGVVVDFEEPAKNPIKLVITVDGGYTEVEVKKTFPSSKIAFFQFGAFLLNLDDWQNLDSKPFISPEDMAKFNDLQRIKFVLPTKFVNRKNEPNLTTSVRKSLYEFFTKKIDDSSLIDTLKWLIYEEYSPKSDISSYAITNPNPYSQIRNIELKKSEMKANYTFDVGGELVYLTDVFRLHEKIDDEIGASGILGHIDTLILQLIIVHYIRTILKIQPQLLEETLFIKDGSLAFFDVTARLHTSMRKLINFLHEKRNLYLVGLEKTGAFADHAHEITKIIEGENKLKPNKILLLSNDYIYKYVTPGDSTKMLYGDRSYYSGKIIFRSKQGSVYVTSIPTNHKEDILAPQKSTFKNIDVILHNISKLKCEMYDSALVPVTLANKLVSLANHPSQVLLEKFAQQRITFPQ